MITPWNHTLRVLLEFVDDNCTNLGWVLALLVGEAAPDLERLSTSHDTLYRAHDLRVLPTALVVLDDPGLGVVERLLRTSVITVGEGEKRIMTLTLRRVLVRPFSYILHAHLSTENTTSAKNGTHDSGRRSINPSPPLFCTVSSISSTWSLSLAFVWSTTTMCGCLGASGSPKVSLRYCIRCSNGNLRDGMSKI